MGWRFTRRLSKRNKTFDDRTFIDEVLYQAKTGIPHRDLSENFRLWRRKLHEANPLREVLGPLGGNKGCRPPLSRTRRVPTELR